MEELCLSDQTLLYKTSFLTKIKKNVILDEILRIILERPNIKNDAFYFNADNPVLKEIIDYSILECTILADKKKLKYNTIKTDFWVNRVKNLNPNQKVITSMSDLNNIEWHDHVSLNEIKDSFKPTYTFVYYAQVPNNLNDIEGYLLIKGSNNDIMYFKPEDNDLIIMDAGIPHSPIGTNNSTIDRLVIAGNVGFLFEKKEKTLL
jgi:hypothetical protein